MTVFYVSGICYINKMILRNDLIKVFSSTYVMEGEVEEEWFTLFHVFPNKSLCFVHQTLRQRGKVNWLFYNTGIAGM